MISLTANRAGTSLPSSLMAMFCAPASAQDQRQSAAHYPIHRTTRSMPCLPQHGMVVAQEKIAAHIGADVLKRGGNAVDAAVAIGFTMAVTYPRAGKYRRRRLHGDPSGRQPSRTSRSIIARPRRRRPRATSSSDPTASPTRPSRSIPRSASACPAPSPGLALALEKYGSGQIHAGGTAEAGDRAGNATASRSPTICADTLAEGRERLARWPASAKFLSRRRRHAAARGRSAGPDRSGADALGDRRAGPARILSGPGRGKAGEGDP